jgi:thiosulfate reductase / polysulfide reductase chain A
MAPEEVKAKLLKTESGRFELKASQLEEHADFIHEKLGVAKDRVGLPQWLEPEYTGGGDLYFVTPKTAVHGEGRTANIPYALTLYQPTVGGRGETYLEIHPKTARERGIRNGDKVKIVSDLGEIETYARFYPPSHPEIVVLPFGLGHWAWGRWASNRRTGNSCEILPNVSDPISGLAGFYTVKVRVEKA